MPSLSHRPSLLFKRHSPTSLVTDSDTDIIETSSPSKVDPFQSAPTYPLPTVQELSSNPDRLSSRQTRGLSRKQTLHESKSTPTPKIVLASPSTSTIHYLFPGVYSTSHLSAIPFDSRLPRYTGVSGSSSGSISGSESDRSIAKKRLSRRSLDEIYDYAPVIESGSSRRLCKPVPRAATRHSPKDSLDYTKGLKTRPAPVETGTTNGVQELGRGHPALTRVTPSTITVLGPTKRVPSLGSEPALKRESIGTRLKLASTTPHAPATSVSLRTINPISSPSSPVTIKKAQSMRTLRRQPSLADLGRKAKKETVRMPALMERENHVEMPKIAQRPVEAGRKRSQSLSSDRQPHLPRPIATAPTTPAVLPPAPGSPILPPPDLGDPLMVTLPRSPSFSHLDYSTAGSSVPSFRSSITPSFTKSRRAIYPSRNLDNIYTNRDAQSPARSQVPVSASMSRGTTREGLGGYDSAKQMAKDDLERRLSARDEERGRTLEKLTRGQSSASESGTSRRFSLRRSQSLKRPAHTKAAGRPRSQSLSAKSVRRSGISLPSPLPEGKKERPMSEAGRGIYLGDLNVDLGGRFLLEASLFPSDTDKSPQSSLYPDTTPSSGSSSLPQSTDPESSFPNTAQPPQQEFYSGHSPRRIERRDSVRSEKYCGRPLHPAFASSTSLLAPSTIGLGFSPIATPVSLPESLMDEAIDLTGGWRKERSERSGSMEDVTITLRDTTKPTSTDDTAGLSRPNQFFLPPLYPNSLRMSKSLGPGVLRSSYLAKATAPPRPTRSPSRGPPTPKEERGNPCESSTRTTVDDASPSGPRKTPKTPRGNGRIVPMPSTFSLCSPPDAIDPLPALQPVGSGSRQLRNNKSTSFLSASASLRGLFKRERQAETPEDTIGSRVTSSGTTCTSDTTGTANSQEVKFKGRIISGPMDLDTSPPGNEEPSKSYGALGDGPRKPHNPPPGQDDGKERDRARRERILSAALSLSLRTKPGTPVSAGDTDNLASGMVMSISKSRMAIPTALLASAPIDHEHHRNDSDRPGATGPIRTEDSPTFQIEPSPGLSLESPSPPRDLLPFSHQISKWFPSPIKPKRRRLKALVRSPSIPSLSLPLHTARSMISLHRAKDSITLSFSKPLGDGLTRKSTRGDGEYKGDDRHAAFDSPRRSFSAEQDRQVIAQKLGSPDKPESSHLDVFSSSPEPVRPGTPKRIPASTLPSGSSLTPRSQRSGNPHASTVPLPSGRSVKWWTSTGPVADRARRLFSPDLGLESMTHRRSYISKPGRDAHWSTTGPVSSNDPPMRKLLEELIQREEEERAEVEARGLDGENQDEGSQEPDEADDAVSQGDLEVVKAPSFELKRQSRSLSRSSSRVERAKKVLDWCEAVDGTKDLRDMEERWRAHVEEERERLRRIGQRKE